MVFAEISYREAEPKDIENMFKLIRSSFDELVAIDYNEEGINEFYKHINPLSLLERLKGEFYTYIAIYDNKVVGLIQLKENNHISLLFVEKSCQQKGIGKTLFLKSLNKCIETKPSINTITVNSSPFAVKVYEKLGFKKTKFEQNINGIRFYPMVYNLEYYTKTNNIV